MSDSLDLKAIRKALEKGAESRQKYEELLLKKGFSEQMVAAVVDNLGEIISPVLEKMAMSVDESNKELVKGISDALRGNDTDDSKAIIDAIQSGFKGIRLPTPKIEMKAPDVHIPEPKPLVMPDTIKAVLEYDRNNPLPVILMGVDGKPFQLSSFSGGGAGGGRGDFYTIVDIKGSTASLIDNIEGGLKVVVLNQTSTTGSTAAALVDSSGVQYSGSNPFPVTLVTDQTATTAVVGDVPAGTADTGSAPIKTGGIARTTNPTAETDGDRVSASFDDVGRQVIRQHQVRDLIATAYVALSTGTETTLLAAGGAGVFLDCIMITATNNSTAAVQLDIRSSTAGSIVHTMYLPASSGPIGWAPSTPWPQDNVNNNWTIDIPDITGTTIYVSALFSKEV